MARQSVPCSGLRWSAHYFSRLLRTAQCRPSLNSGGRLQISSVPFASSIGLPLRQVRGRMGDSRVGCGIGPVKNGRASHSSEGPFHYSIATRLKLTNKGSKNLHSIKLLELGKSLAGSPVRKFCLQSIAHLSYQANNNARRQFARCD
jgi:hypothetical protein